MESNFQVRLLNSDRNKRTNRAWPKEDDLLLLDLLQKHATIKDIERILDRTSTAIKNRRKVLISKNTGGRTTSRRRNPAQSISWRNMALQGLHQLPSEQGTFKDLAPVIENLFGEQLNRVLLAGHNSYSVWRAQLSNVLADEKGFKAPRFESIGERHGKSLVYRITSEGKRIIEEGFENQKRGNSVLYETFLGGIFTNRRGKRFSESPGDSNNSDVGENEALKSTVESSSPIATVVYDDSIEAGLIASINIENNNVGFGANESSRMEKEKFPAKELDLSVKRITTDKVEKGPTHSYSYISTLSPIGPYNLPPFSSLSSPPTFRRSLSSRSPSATDLHKPISLYSHRNSVSSDTPMLPYSIPSSERVIINVMDRERLARFIMSN